MEYTPPNISGVNNDPDTWLVDWSEPVEWNDGTPAQAHGQAVHGQIYILMDPDNLPKGFHPSGLRQIQVSMSTPRQWIAATNVIAAYGTPLDGYCRCHIVNRRHRVEREALETHPAFGTF